MLSNLTVRWLAGIVAQPGTLSYLELGWILTAAGQPLPVQDVDFKVHRFT